MLDETEYQEDINDLARYTHMIDIPGEVVENALDVLARKHERRLEDVSREFYRIMAYYLGV